MWSQEEEMDVVEKTQNFHFHFNSELLSQLELYYETAPKIVYFPPIFS